MNEWALSHMSELDLFVSILCIACLGYCTFELFHADSANAAWTCLAGMGFMHTLILIQLCF
jgi:hypothetical protein